MMDNINEFFNQYVELTSNIIKKVDADEEINQLMEQRQVIIQKISEIPIGINEKKAVYEKLEIKKIDDELGRKLDLRLSELKNEIKKVIESRNAFSTYQSNMMQENLFSKRV